ncbi:MAG TPA: DUF6603 domain-containing protein [Gemmatimonadaceae bacterium]|nr:DUF6603 domain-containing protein [Gemmatimonadaceae bacterium]
MDIQTLITVLNSHITGSRLDLPVNALQSAAIQQQCNDVLPGENLIIDPITTRQEDKTSVTIVGRGGNALFQGMKVSACFRAGEPTQLFITTSQDDDGWTVTRSFLSLEHTLVSDLPFKSPSWHLASIGDGTREAGLFFQGTMDTANGLGFFTFLIGNTDEVLSGKVNAITTGIPTMRLAGGVRDGTRLGFLTLGPINLALVTAALQLIQPDRPIQPSVAMEVSTNLEFTARGKRCPIPLKAEIRQASSSIRLDAEITQLIDVGLDELKALANTVRLDGLSFGGFSLENVVKLTQLTFIVDPLAESRLTSMALTVESAQSWDLLTRADKTPFLTLQNIRVMLGMSAPFAASDLSAMLRGEIMVGDARIIVDALVSSQDVQLRGMLDNYTRLSLREIAGYFLGETDPHTPELIIDEFDLLIQPKQHYKLAVTVQDLWTIQLGDKQLHLESISALWEHTDGGQTDACLSGTMQVGGVDIVIEALYDKATGWDFNGKLEGQTVLVENVLGDILHYFDADLPPFMNTIAIDTLSVHFNTTSKDFDFEIGGDLSVDDKRLEIVVTVALQHTNNEFSFEVSGTLTIGDDYTFKLAALRDTTDSVFIATYSHSGPPASVPLQQFVSDHLSTSAAQFVPSDLRVDVKDLLFAIDSVEEGNRFLFALDLATGINLTNLPLVGREFPPEQTVGVNDLQIAIASTAFSQEVVRNINHLIEGRVTALPDAVASGVTFQAVLQLGEGKQSLALPVVAADRGQQPTTSRQESAIVTSADNTKWFTLQRNFGPVQLQRIGVAYRNSELWFLLDGSFSVGALTLGLEGLGLGSPLKEFHPDFTLQGLTLEYTASAVAISGAFLKSTIRYNSKDYTAYSGKAAIKAETFTLDALGSYIQLDEGPSLFVYAFLDYPIGGPAFFFVRGLAAGFGYNRRLSSPSIERVADFPLVREATGQKEPGTLSDELRQLQDYLPPSVGDLFLAIGVRFTSFNMIDTFVLLSVGFGHRFELNVLGLSTMILPSPGTDSAGVTPLAELQLALRATFVPDEGFFGVNAQLTQNSYLLARECHLTGGFAFYSWFGDQHDRDQHDGDQHHGDFVLTVGGYHPRFSPPEHYPVVPRLGFNWPRVADSNLMLKGSAYYTLLPSMLMAGGNLSATWEDGDLKAWFDASMDFLIAWKPYHYEADFHVSVGASYTYWFFGSHQITAHVGADVSIWGPTFAGKAYIDLSIVSFTIRFGPQEKPSITPIDWPQFRQSFLPAKDEEICTITVSDGMVQQDQPSHDANGSSDELVTINPRELVLATDSVVPSKTARLGEAGHDTALPTDDATLDFGIGPMDKKDGDLRTTQRIVITHGGEPFGDHFDYRPLRKNLPFALWGGELLPSMNNPQMMRDMLTGYEIRPKAPLEPGDAPWLPRGALQNETPLFSEDAFGWLAPAPFVPQAPDDDGERRRLIEQTIDSEQVRAKRANIAGALFADAVLDLAGFGVDEFLAAPQVAVNSPRA